MKKAVAKGRRLFSLAAVLVLAAAFLVTVPAEASRTYNPPITATLQQPRLSQKMQERITEKAERQAENRFRLFEDLSLPPHPLEWVPLRKTASGVFDLGIGCNTREKGVLDQNCSGSSFQGLWTDPTTGLSYARNRWYDARTASWLSEDPLGAVDSPNLYAFVGWAPHLGADPMGLYYCYEGETCMGPEGEFEGWLPAPPTMGPAPEVDPLPDTRYGETGDHAVRAVVAPINALNGFDNAGRMVVYGPRGVLPTYIPPSSKAQEEADKKIFALSLVPIVASVVPGGRMPAPEVEPILPEFEQVPFRDKAPVPRLVTKEQPPVPGEAHNAVRAAQMRENLRVAERANPLVDSLKNTGRLPENFVTKSEAAAAGWQPGKALGNSVPEGQLGGDVFQDPGSIGLPIAPGRIWYEADVGLTNTMSRAKQPGSRLLYSDDGLVYLTSDHYLSLYQLPDWK